MDEFVLDYDLLPLLHKELVISKVALISPRIHVKRLKDGTFNFSDMLAKPEEGGAKAEKAPAKESGGLPVSLTTDRVLLKDAQLEFIDEMKEIPDVSLETDADFKVSLKDGVSADGFLDIKKLDATLGGIKTSTSGRVDINKELIEANITSTIDGKDIDLKASVKDYSGDPKIDFSLKADELDVDKLMALTGGGKKGKKEAEAPSPKAATSGESKPLKVTASGTVEVKTARYGEYTLNDLNADAGASVTIARPENSVSGEVDLRKLEASMQGVTLSASGKANLTPQTVRVALDTTVDVPTSYTYEAYSLEKAHISASPNITYTMDSQDVSGSIGIKELSAASLKSSDFSVTALSLSGKADVAYNVPSGKMRADADLASLSANYDGIDVSTAGKVSYDGVTATAKLTGASVKAAEYKNGEHTIRNLDLLADTDLKIALEKKEPVGSVTIKTLKANVDGIDVSAKGTLSTDGKIAHATFSELTARSEKYQYDTYVLTGLSLSAVTDMKVDIDEKLPAGGTVDLKELKANVNGVDTSVVGKVSADARNLKTDVTVTVDKDSAKLTATAKDYRTAPNVNFDVYSKQLDINKLMSLSGPEKKEGEAAQPQKAATGKKEKTKPLTARGKVRIDRADYQDYQIEGLDVTLNYVNDVMTVDPMKMTLKGGTSMVIDGAFLGNVKFTYPRDRDDASEVMKQTMTGKGASKFKKIQIKDVKVASAIAKITSLEELKNPTFTDSEINYDIKDQKVNITGFMNSERIKVVPSGYVGLNKAIDMAINLNLDPTLARRLIITQAIKESDGTTTLPLVVKGTTDDPKVTINAKKVINKTLKNFLAPPPKEEGTQTTTPTTEEQQTTTPPPEEQKPEEQIKKMFKGLFK